MKITFLTKSPYFFLLFSSAILISMCFPLKKVWGQASTINFGITVTEPVASDANKKITLTSELITQVDRSFSQEYINHLDVSPKNNLSLLEVPAFLGKIDQETGTKSAIVYVYLQPIGEDVLDKATSIGPLDSSVGGVLPPNKNPQATDGLVLVIATGQGLFTPVPVPEVSRRDLLILQKQFQNNLVNIAPKDLYLPQAIRFYEWLVSPMKEILQKQEIGHISFILDSGLRSLPIAALYDRKEEKFLVEEYSLGLMPSLSLTNITRQKLIGTKLLAMGADTFPDQQPLPAVPLELNEIGKSLWDGTIYLNQNFTVENFQKAVASRDYSIVHLATHGEFNPGDRNNSFVVFSDQNLKMDQFADTGLDQPVDLMTLSACRTALGDPEAELGFAGLAVKTGVRTAIGSLWNVSDEGTFALMTNLYSHLKQSTTKASALQKAQRGFIRRKIEVNNGNIRIDTVNIPTASLPPAMRENLTTKNLSHPYYWSAFTLIGNPW